MVEPLVHEPLRIDSRKLAVVFSAKMQPIRLRVGLLCLYICICITARTTVFAQPSITAQPVNRTVQIGQRTNVTVTASGTGTLSYQWYHNGALIQGATTSSYGWSNPSFSDAGIYYVNVSDGTDSTQSANMTLTVKCPEGGATDFQFVGDAQGYINAVLLQPDGKICIGGDFTKFDGMSINRLARLNADGTIDTTFMNGLSGADREVRSLVLQPDGRLLACGAFTTIHGTNQTRIARLTTNGALDSTFSCQIPGGTSTAVSGIALQTNGQMVVWGGFTNINGTLITNLARLNANGTLDATFKPVIKGSFVQGVVMQSDGKMIVTGTFTNVNGFARTNLARVNQDGTLDSAFQGTLILTVRGINDIVNVSVENSGKLLLSGSFTNINGASRYHLARLNSDGSLDADILNGSSGDDVNGGGVGAVEQPDGKLILIGNFFHVNGVARRGLARLNADGSLDDTFQNGMIGNPNQSLSGGFIVNEVLQPDGKIILVGRFSDFNGATARGIVRLWGSQPACIENTSVIEGGGVMLTVRGTPGVTNVLQFKNSVSDPGWNDLPIYIFGTDPSTTTNVVDSLPENAQRVYRLRQLP